MKKTIILLKSNYIINNDNEYDFFELDEVKKTFSQNIKVIILDEELYIKSFKYNNRFLNVPKFVEEKINEFFPQNGDILYDYEDDKLKSMLYLYSVKSGEHVRKICENIKEIEILPIQYIIRDTIKDISKKRKITCVSIVKIKEKFYLIYLKNGVIEMNTLFDNCNSIIRKISEIENVGIIYIDDNINGYIDEMKLKYLKNFKIIKTNIGEKIYERIYKK